MNNNTNQQYEHSLCKECPMMANIETEIIQLLHKNNVTLTQTELIFDSIVQVINSENPITI